MAADVVGLGILVLDHDWNYGARRVDFDDLTRQVQKAKEDLTRLFKSWGLEDVEIGLWLQTDMR